MFYSARKDANTLLNNIPSAAAEIELELKEVSFILWLGQGGRTRDGRSWERNKIEPLVEDAWTGEMGEGPGSEMVALSATLILSAET
ncbi:hypothetical protein GBA52_017748 [Prunus armeniaca]|nr:hypothetical protein GBA52_017748 [Prunus armeniaca]